MFISFLTPYQMRYVKAQYLWVFYKQLNMFNPDEIVFIAGKDYFVDPETIRNECIWEFSKPNMIQYGYDIPSAQKISEYQCFSLPSKTFIELKEKSLTPDKAWGILLSETYEPLVNDLEEIIKNIIQENCVEAIFTWSNCPSLTKVATKYSIPVIHNEVGSLRFPMYTQTAYLDFRGVGGKTECSQRYNDFKEEICEKDVCMFSHEDIRSLFISDSYYNVAFENREGSSYEIGIALQVENDSNLISYSDGLNNFDIINIIKEKYSKNEILIRMHPGGFTNYKDKLGDIDNSLTSIDFIKRCKRLATINSSTCFEALLFEKPVWFRGDNPFRYMNNFDACGDIDYSHNLEKFNFAVFGYMIPYSLLFNVKYYRWRLTKPTEIEIYNYHLSYYLNEFVQKYNSVLNGNLTKEDIQDNIYELREKMIQHKHKIGVISYEGLLGNYYTKMYISQNNIFEEKNTVILKFDSNKEYFNFSFVIPTNLKNIDKIRWDPIEARLCSVKLSKISIEYDNRYETYDLTLIKHNGEKGEDGYINFFTVDPILTLDLPGDIKSVSLSGQWQFYEDINDYVKQIYSNENKIQELYNNIHAIEIEKTTLHEVIAKKDIDIDFLNQKLYISIETNKTISNTLKENSEVLLHYKNEQSRLSEQLSLSDEKLIAYKSILDDIKSELVNTKSELDNTRSILEYTQFEYDNIKANLYVAQSELETLGYKMSKIDSSRSYKILKKFTKLKKI